MANYYLNDKITELWIEYSEYFDDDKKTVMLRTPNYYSKPDQNKVLYIGLNPSYQSNHKNPILNEFSANISSEIVDEIAEISTSSKKIDNENYYAKYYKILHDITKEIGESSFIHCDMFLMRERDSKLVKKMIYRKKDLLNEFGIKQLDILENFIIDANPKMIIVPNAMVSEIYRDKYTNKNMIDGVYYSNINNKKIPTLLCGSWQYGRLDSFTKELIVFHIKRLLTKI